MSLAGDWVRLWDARSGRWYYFEQCSEVSQWEEPPCWTGLDGLHLTSARVRAALRIQGMARKRRARRIVREKRAEKSGIETDEQGWMEIKDPASGWPYFYNTKTRVSTWDRPQGFQTNSATQVLAEEINPVGAAQKQVEENQALETTQGKNEETTTSMPQELEEHKVETYAGEIPSEKEKCIWWSAIDQESGFPYYYNSETGETTWERPEEYSSTTEKAEEERSEELKEKMRLAFQGKLFGKETPEMIARMKAAREKETIAKSNRKRRWCEALDPATGCFYYYDVENFETVWEKPQDFVLEASDLLLSSTLKIQGLFRSKAARKKTRVRRAEREAKKSGTANTWIELWEKGYPYYYNQSTQEVRWEKPRDFVEGDDPCERGASPGSPVDTSANAQSETDDQTKTPSSLAESCAALVSTLEEQAPVKLTKKQLDERRKEVGLLERRLAIVQLSADLSTDRLVRLKHICRKTEGFLPKSDEQQHAKLKSVMQSFRVAELALRELAECFSSASRDIRTYSEKALQDIQECSEQEISEAEAAVEPGLNKCTKNCVFAEAQLVVAARSLFGLYSSIIHAVEQHIQQIKSLAVKENVANSSAVKNALKAAETQVAETKIQRKHVELFAHRNFVTEALQKERFVAVQKRDRNGGSYNAFLESELKSTHDDDLVEEKGKDKSANVNRIEIADQVEEKQYAEAISKTKSLIAEHQDKVREKAKEDGISTLAEELGLDQEEDELSSELIFKLERFTGSSPWWPSYHGSIAGCLTSRELAMQAEVQVQDIISTNLQRRQERLVLAASANRAAELKSKQGLEYELECRRAFVQMCRKAWQKGIDLQQREARENGYSTPRERENGTSRMSPGTQARANKDGHGAKDSSIVRVGVYRTPWDACSKGCSLEVFQQVLEEARKRRENQELRTFDIDAPDPISGRVLLHTACWFGNMEVIKYLLSIGANPNATQSRLDPTTPLLVAVRANHPDIVRVLAAAGSTILAVDASGDSALHWACRVDSLPCVRAVLEIARSESVSEVVGMDDTDETPYWQLLAKVNHRSRTPTECLPRHQKRNNTTSQPELSYTGRRIYDVLRDLEIEAQHKLLDFEMLDKNTSNKAAKILKNYQLTPLRT